MRDDPIMAELERTREEILARFNGDFEAYLDYLDTLEAENRKRGLRYGSPRSANEVARSDAA